MCLLTQIEKDGTRIVGGVIKESQIHNELEPINYFRQCMRLLGGEREMLLSSVMVVVALHEKARDNMLAAACCMLAYAGLVFIQ